MNPWMMQQMEQAGMQPIYGPGGLRTMAYSMKAPLAKEDTMHDLTGITGDFGTPEHDAGWGRFFNQHAPPGPLDAARDNASWIRQSPSGVDEDTAFGGGGTTTSYGTSFLGAGIPSASDHVGASIAQNSKWLGQQGIGFPPPPQNFFPGDSGTKSMADTVSFQERSLPTPLTGPMGNKTSDAANLAQNQSLYAPGGWKALPPVPPTQTQQDSAPGMWHGPTKWTPPGTFGTPYGNASVSYIPPAPMFPANNFPPGGRNG